MLVIKVYSNNNFLGYLDSEKRDVTRHASNAKIFDDEEIEEVKNISKRFSDCKIVKWEVEKADNNFARFLDKDRITKCNLDLDLFQFESPLDKRKCEKFMPKNIYELSEVK